MKRILLHIYECMPKHRNVDYAWLYSQMTWLGCDIFVSDIALVAARTDTSWLKALALQETRLEPQPVAQKRFNVYFTPTVLCLWNVKDGVVLWSLRISVRVRCGAIPEPQWCLNGMEALLKADLEWKGEITGYRPLVQYLDIQPFSSAFWQAQNRLWWSALVRGELVNQFAGVLIILQTSWPSLARIEDFQVATNFITQFSKYQELKWLG